MPTIELSGAVVQVMRSPEGGSLSSSTVDEHVAAPGAGSAVGGKAAVTEADRTGLETEEHREKRMERAGASTPTAESNEGDAVAVAVRVYGTDEQRASAEALVRHAAAGVDVAAATGKRNRAAERERLRQAMAPGSNAVRIAIDLSMGVRRLCRCVAHHRVTGGSFRYSCSICIVVVKHLILKRASRTFTSEPT